MKRFLFGERESYWPVSVKLRSQSIGIKLLPRNVNLGLNHQFYNDAENDSDWMEFQNHDY